MRRRSGLDIPQTIEDACDPATMALIIYDMQAGVLGQLPDAAPDDRARVRGAHRGGRRLSGLLHQAHVPAPQLMGTAQLRTAMAWQHVDDPEQVQSWFLRDTPGFQIIPDLAPRADRGGLRQARHVRLRRHATADGAARPRYPLLRHRRRRPGDRHRADHLACRRPRADPGGRDRRLRRPGPASHATRPGQHPVLRRRAADRHRGHHATAGQRLVPVKAWHPPRSGICACPTTAPPAEE